MTKNMKIVVIGGSGLIGTKLVNNLRQQGHEVGGRITLLGGQHPHW
jgi:nucleoside-diphosphate-sugar epimerase